MTGRRGGFAGGEQDVVGFGQSQGRAEGGVAPAADAGEVDARPDEVAAVDGDPRSTQNRRCVEAGQTTCTSR